MIDYIGSLLLTSGYRVKSIGARFLNRTRSSSSGDQIVKVSMTACSLPNRCMMFVSQWWVLVDDERKSLSLRSNKNSYPVSVGIPSRPYAVYERSILQLTLCRLFNGQRSVRHLVVTIEKFSIILLSSSIMRVCYSLSLVIEKNVCVSVCGNCFLSLLF